MKYSKEEKEKILKEYNASGMSAVKFCETQKVGVATLNRWLGFEKTKFLKLGSIENKIEQNAKVDEICMEFCHGQTKFLKISN
ncbi:MAG: IS630 transposase-related protein [Clostridia bacterium]